MKLKFLILSQISCFKGYRGLNYTLHVRKNLLNYLGSKKYLTTFLHENIKTFCGSLEDKTICDIFSGTGIVANTFTCKKLLVNDVEAYCYVRLKQLFDGLQKEEYHTILSSLNALQPLQNGLITQLYSKYGEAKRNYFTTKNAQKIDAIRTQIDFFKNHKTYSPKIINALLASLLEASDMVANTACMYGAYLKKVKYTATKPLILTPLEPFKQKATIFHEDSLKLLDKIQGDILYLDPPYNHRQYGLNYHILNTIVEYQMFKPKGKSGYGNYFRSRWCQALHVKEELRQTLQKANFKYIALSYNNEGILDNNFIKNEFEKFGNYHQVSTTHDKLRMNKKSLKNTTEYLHLLEKR